MIERVPVPVERIRVAFNESNMSSGRFSAAEKSTDVFELSVLSFPFSLLLLGPLYHHISPSSDQELPLTAFLVLDTRHKSP